MGSRELESLGMNERQAKLEKLYRRYTIDILYIFGRHAGEVKHWFGNRCLELSVSNSDVDIGVKPSYEVLSKPDAELLMILAGYRNRLVHFYHEVSSEELYNICKTGLADLERIAHAYPCG
jgi:hypothetical protein